MERIKGIAELQPIVDRLQEKGLIQLLTPPVRGCVLTHALYQEQELDKLRREFEGQSEGRRSVPSEAAMSRTAISADPNKASELDAVRSDVASLKRQLAELQEQVADLGTLRDALEKLNRELGV